LRGEAVCVVPLPGLLDDAASIRAEAGSDRVHVLARVAPQAESYPFGAVPSLRKVVLGQAELARACLEHDSSKLAAFLPPLGDIETQAIAVPGETGLDIV